MQKETHPYIREHFDSNRSWKHLIIGTFPPNREAREGSRSLTDYFYGNKGSLWKILGAIYSEFDFKKGTREELIQKMKSWQIKYNIGITDTILYAKRTNINSSDDSDLILEYTDYNHDLKDYILKNNEYIESIIFTSSKGCNSAYETFKIIMGKEINLIKAKLLINLPSPSGSSNTSWFNVNNEKTLGLHPEFYDYIVHEKKEHIIFFKNRWEVKKKKKIDKSTQVPKSPEGILSEFKIWSYKNALPRQIN